MSEQASASRYLVITIAPAEQPTDVDKIFHHYCASMSQAQNLYDFVSTESPAAIYDLGSAKQIAAKPRGKFTEIGIKFCRDCGRETAHVIEEQTAELTTWCCSLCYTNFIGSNLVS